MRRLPSLLLWWFCVTGAGPAIASTYTYDVSLTTTSSLGFTVSGFVSGEIVTTCNDCWLSPYNVVSWSFTATSTDPMVPAIENISSANNGAIWTNPWDIGRNLYATPSALAYHPNTDNFCFCEVGSDGVSHRLLVFDYVNNHGDWFFLYDDDGVYPYTVDLDVAVGPNDLQIATINTPLPSAVSLFATGLAGLFLLTQRRRRNDVKHSSDRW